MTFQYWPWIQGQRGNPWFTGWNAPKCSPQKFSTLFQHISAVAVVNIVNILSRSIASSFHLKRSVTLKKVPKRRLWPGIRPEPGLGSSQHSPRPRSRLGSGTPCRNPHPSSTPSASWYRHLLEHHFSEPRPKFFPTTLYQVFCK